MSDPYAPENLLKGGPSAPPPQLKQPDYLFPENFDQNFRRSWGERLTFHIGSAYLAGLTCGTAYGLQEGLRATAGERQRIWINGVLNAVGKQGPGLGNGLGCLAMIDDGATTRRPSRVTSAPRPDAPWNTALTRAPLLLRRPQARSTGSAW